MYWKMPEKRTSLQARFTENRLMENSANNAAYGTDGVKSGTDGVKSGTDGVKSGIDGVKVALIWS